MNFDTNVPRPEKVTSSAKKGAKSVYGFLENMQVDQSFFRKVKPVSMRQNLRAFNARTGKNYKFTVEVEINPLEGEGCRVWRDA